MGYGQAIGLALFLLFCLLALFIFVRSVVFNVGASHYRDHRRLFETKEETAWINAMVQELQCCKKIIEMPESVDLSALGYRRLAKERRAEIYRRRANASRDRAMAAAREILEK